MSVLRVRLLDFSTGCIQQQSTAELPKARISVCLHDVLINPQVMSHSSISELNSITALKSTHWLLSCWSKQELWDSSEVSIVKMKQLKEKTIIGSAAVDMFDELSLSYWSNSDIKQSLETDSHQAVCSVCS